MIIIHGDNILESSKRLVEITDKNRSSGNITTLDANNLKLEALRQELSPTDLFGNSSLVVLKGLLSGNKKKQTEKIITFLKEENFPNLVLYETKSVHPSTVRQFKNATVESFKVSIDIFHFLEQITPEQKTKTLEGYKKLLQNGVEAEFIFAMLLRQIRILIQVKTNFKELKIPVFAINKIKNQAAQFTLDQLLDMHTKLYNIEVSIKTGKTHLDLKTLLHQFIFSL